MGYTANRLFNYPLEFITYRLAYKISYAYIVYKIKHRVLKD